MPAATHSIPQDTAMAKPSLAPYPTPPPAFSWKRLNAYTRQSAEGYRIAMNLCRGVRRFAAFAPSVTVSLKISYVLGEAVPQQRASLGVFDDVKAAERACMAHRRAAAASTSPVTEEPSEQRQSMA